MPCTTPLTHARVFFSLGVSASLGRRHRVMVQEAGDGRTLSSLLTDSTLDAELDRRVGKKNASASQPWSIQSSDPLGFVHIGKCAGTSFDKWIGQHLRQHHRKRGVIGANQHVDMSYIKAQSLHFRPRVLAFLREPGKRAASNLLFWNTLSFTKNWKSRNWSLSQVLGDDRVARQYLGATGDGWGGVCWLAGLCQTKWYVRTSPVGKKENSRRKLILTGEPMKALQMAKHGLQGLAWFGLLEDSDRSMELLKWQLGLDMDTPGLTALNVNKVKEKVADEDLQLLRKRAPLDVALYKHAQGLFEKRWKAYQEALREGKAAASAGDVPSADDPGITSLTGMGIDLKWNIFDASFIPHDEAVSDFVAGDDY